MPNDIAALADQLLERHTQLQTLLQTLREREPILPGSLYTLRRRCGKPTCHCAQGELHASTVLSYRGQGRPQCITPTTGQLQPVQKLTDAYRQFRQARAQLVRLQHQMRTLLDRIEAARVQQGEHLFQKIRAAASQARTRTRSRS